MTSAMVNGCVIEVITENGIVVGAVGHDKKL
jgi:hypothetical protein